MMNNFCKITLIIFFAVLMSTSVFATSGDNLIGVGPISRAIGSSALPRTTAKAPPSMFFRFMTSKPGPRADDYIIDPDYHAEAYF